MHPLQNPEMKNLFTTVSFFYILFSSSGQGPEIKSMVDSLRFINADTLNCKADLYWRIIAKGKVAIPFLIEKLADTTPTNIKYHCKKARLNVAEVAHFALTQIAEFPAYVVTKIQFDIFNNAGCWIFYDYLFNNANKAAYKKSVQDWYAKQKENYRLKRISIKYQTGCQKLFGIKAYYRWKG